MKEEYQKEWQDLIKKYKENKTLEEFKNQFPRIDSSFDYLETLYLLFDHVKSLVTGKIKKVNFDTFLPIIFEKYKDILKSEKFDLAYIDLHKSKDLNMLPTSFTQFLNPESNVKALKNLLYYLAMLKKLDGLKSLNAVEFQILFHIYVSDITDERYLKNASQMNRMTREILKDHEKIQDFINWRKNLTEIGGYSDTTLRKYIMKLSEIGYSLFGVLNGNYIGVKMYCFDINPPCFLWFKENQIRNFIVRGNPSQSFSQSRFWCTPEQFPLLMRKVERLLPAEATVTAFEVTPTEVFINPEGSHEHFLKNGEILLNKKYLIDKGNQVLTKYESIMERDQRIYEVITDKVQRLPKEIIDEKALRFMWSWVIEPLASNRQFRKYTGLKRHHKQEMMEKYINLAPTRSENLSPKKLEEKKKALEKYVVELKNKRLFMYYPALRIFGAQFMKHLLIRYEKEGPIFTWEVELIKELFSLLPFHGIVHLRSITQESSQAIEMFVLIPRNSLKTFLQYIRFIETNFITRFKFNVLNVEYQDTTLPASNIVFYDEQGKNYMNYEKAINSLRIVPLEDIDVI